MDKITGQRLTPHYKKPPRSISIEKIVEKSAVFNLMQGDKKWVVVFCVDVDDVPDASVFEDGKTPAIYTTGWRGQWNKTNAIHLIRSVLISRGK